MTTVRVNLRNAGVTQYGKFPFISFAVFQGIPLGAGPEGIFRLNGGEKDVHTVTTTDERNIDAWFELSQSQYGIDAVKQGRRLYLGGEFSGDMTVTVNTLGVSTTYQVSPKDTALAQHVFQIPLSCKQKAEYWSMTVANVNGSDFSVDFIDATFVNVNRRFAL
jgi:hypothetical protein